MLVRMLLIVAALLGAYFLIRRLRRLAWRQQIPRLAVAASVMLLLLLLTARGGAEIALPLLTVLAPLLARWLGGRPLPFPAGSTRSKSSGRSTVNTRFLSVELDHATGAMSGQVRAGHFARRALQELPLPELLELWRECQPDPESVAVLEAYLDRHAVADWRERVRDAGQAKGTDDSSREMNRSEAYQVLGLRPGASREEIQAAYRRLIQRVHPDHGGSPYLATRLNQARDVLLSG